MMITTNNQMTHCGMELEDVLGQTVWPAEFTDLALEAP